MLSSRHISCNRPSTASTLKNYFIGDNGCDSSRKPVTKIGIFDYPIEKPSSPARRVDVRCLRAMSCKSLSTIEGGCLCGAVRYRASGKAYGITHCHCRTCRHASGAPLVTWAGFDSDRFNFTHGQPVSYASSKNVVRTFCGRCGTALTYRRLDLPNSVDVTLGSMDEPERLSPEDHTWTESRISWARLSDDLPAYPRERKSK